MLINLPFAIWRKTGCGASQFPSISTDENLVSRRWQLGIQLPGLVEDTAPFITVCKWLRTYLFWLWFFTSWWRSADSFCLVVLDHSSPASSLLRCRSATMLAQLAEAAQRLRRGPNSLVSVLTLNPFHLWPPSSSLSSPGQGLSAQPHPQGWLI